MTDDRAVFGAGNGFRAGERVLLIDRRRRRYLVRLEEGQKFHTHAGTVDHAEIIGRMPGSVAASASGARFVALRPTLADLIVEMPRGAQVIYPKDLGALMMLADVFPGARILESGVGSGALSMAMLRVGASVTGYEIREDFADRARRNVLECLGEDAGARFEVRIGDVYDGVEGGGYDRMVLDLPEPWRLVKTAADVLVPGGILAAYLPSIIQVSQLREALDQSAFGMAVTEEVLVRTWHVEGLAVRPDHRMVAHTGFLTAARLLGPEATHWDRKAEGGIGTERKRRPGVGGAPRSGGGLGWGAQPGEAN